MSPFAADGSGRTRPAGPGGSVRPPRAGPTAQGQARPQTKTSPGQLISPPLQLLKPQLAAPVQSTRQSALPRHWTLQSVAPVQSVSQVLPPRQSTRTVPALVASTSQLPL